MSHLIYPPMSFNFSRVGLRSTRNFKLHVTWLNEEPWIKRRNNRSAWIAWTRGPPDPIKRTCFKGVIIAQIKRTGVHPECWIVIQRRRSDAFYNRLFTWINPSPPSRSDDHDLSEMVHGEPFHLNRRLKTIGRSNPNAL